MGQEGKLHCNLDVRHTHLHTTKHMHAQLTVVLPKGTNPTKYIKRIQHRLPNRNIHTEHFLSIAVKVWKQTPKLYIYI